ncbi:MAG TPA: hypothetical protein VM888_09165 [Chitinophagaceae bacterium]|nr:hypothetical protein [Chitinophagaceae bacterium]
MENLIFLITGSLVYCFASSSKGTKGYNIGNSGCRVPLFTDKKLLTRARTKSGDVMHFGEIKDGAVTYGLITIQMHKRCKQQDEKILADFMNSLHSSMNIKHNTGLEYRFIKKENKSVKGIADYWQDEHGADWKVKGWTNGKCFGFLYVKNITALSAFKTDNYLDSFTFPK